MKIRTVVLNYILYSALVCHGGDIPSELLGTWNIFAHSSNHSTHLDIYSSEGTEITKANIIITRGTDEVVTTFDDIYNPSNFLSITSPPHNITTVSKLKDNTTLTIKFRYDDDPKYIIMTFIIRGDGYFKSNTRMYIKDSISLTSTKKIKVWRRGRWEQLLKSIDRVELNTNDATVTRNNSNNSNKSNKIRRKRSIWFR